MLDRSSETRDMLTELPRDALAELLFVRLIGQPLVELGEVRHYEFRHDCVLFDMIVDARSEHEPQRRRHVGKLIGRYAERVASQWRAIGSLLRKKIALLAKRDYVVTLSRTAAVRVHFVERMQFRRAEAAAPPHVLYCKTSVVSGMIDFLRVVKESDV